MNISKISSTGKVDLALGTLYLYFWTGNIMTKCWCQKVLTVGNKAGTTRINLLARMLYSYRTSAWAEFQKYYIFFRKGGFSLASFYPFAQLKIDKSVKFYCLEFNPSSMSVLLV